MADAKTKALTTSP